MSRSSRRRKRQSQIRKGDKTALRASSPEAGNENTHDANRPNTKPQAEQAGPLNFLTIFGAGVILFGSVGIGIAVNRISVSVKAWYLSAFALCLFLIWKTYKMPRLRLWLIPGYFLIVFGTHKYVQFELISSAPKDAESPKTEIAKTVPVEKATLEPVKPTLQQEIVSYSRAAQARQWQPPTLSKTTPDIAGKRLVIVKFGGVTQRVPIGSEEDEDGSTARTFVTPGGWPVSPYIKDNKVYVKTQTQFGESATTVKMCNEWPAKIPDGWDRNFNDTSFEIVDRDSLPVFQIRYHRADAIEIYGVFVGPEGDVTVAFGDLTLSAPPGQMPDVPERKAWFKYPSMTQLGVLAD